MTEPSADTPPPLPTLDDLQREQQILANQKLRIETANLERQSKPEPWWSRFGKNIIAFGGAVTVVATLYGIWDSYNKTIIDRQRTRVADQRVRFEDAVKRLESSNTISKLVGVAVLSGYLDAENKDAHRQVLFTLAGLMATEKDAQTQSAVIDLISAIPAKGAIAELDWFYFQDILVSQSRALAAKGNLTSRRNFVAGPPVSEEERNAQVVGKLIALNIRKAAVPGYTGYQGIYCVACDFHGSTFPRAANFTGAILDNANFNGAKLAAASFDNAELAGATFAEADLSQARFRSLDEAAINSAGTASAAARTGRTSYLDNIVRSLGANASVTIRMPKFDCANLEGADFAGHALFPGPMFAERKYLKGDDSKPGWYRTVADFIKEDAERHKEGRKFPVVRIFPPSFAKSNLKGINLKDTQFFAVGASGDWTEFMASARAIRTGEYIVWMGSPDSDLFKDPPAEGAKGKKKDEDDSHQALRRELESTRQHLRAVFYMTPMDNVVLQDDFQAYLKSAPASAADYRASHASSPFVFSKADTDLDCRPRQE